MKMYSYPPGDQFPLTVTNYFNINAGGATKRTSHHKTFAIADDVTLVRGHQLGFGANVRRWKFDTVSTSAPAAVGPLTAARPGTRLRIC